MLITKEQQEAVLDKYIKEKHSIDECAGFVDGLKAMLELIEKINNPKENDIIPVYAEMFVLETIEGAKPKIYSNGNADWLNKDGKHIFHQDFQNEWLNVSYKNICSFLNINLGLNRDEIQELLTKVLHNYIDNGNLNIKF